MRKLVILSLTTVFLLAGKDFVLPSGCRLPFDDIAAKPDPYVRCGVDGSDKSGKTPKEAKKLEDDAKNTFCADAGSPVVVDFKTLEAMQKQSPAKDKLKTDRKALHGFFNAGSGRKLGEGDVVRLKAFIKEAHISDCSKGETVNCMKKGVASNDFHIPLVDPTASNPRAQDECTSVTAEMSPHFRPAAWSEIDLKTPARNPVRVTGPLFYDNSHSPCKRGRGGKLTGPNPKRISLWEIHPVYALEVCAEEDPARCDVASDRASTWVPYDEWVKRPGAAIEATGAKQRQKCEPASRRRSRKKR